MGIVSKTAKAVGSGIDLVTGGLPKALLKGLGVSTTSGKAMTAMELEKALEATLKKLKKAK